MKVYAVVYRDDTNGDSICIGVTKTRESAVKLLNEKLESVMTDITGNREDDTSVNDVEICNDTEWTINYNEAYVDTCQIQELELAD